MRVVRIFNNSLVLAVDEQNREKMILGKGIGFNSRVNSIIDHDRIEKVFVLETSEEKEKEKEKFKYAMKDTPAEYEQLTRKIISQAEKDLDTVFNEGVFVGLLDHLSYALYRISQKDTIKNALLWEIKKFYGKEFKAALKALDLIEKELNIQLSEDEAGFIAIHFVNGQQNGEKTSPMMDAQVINDIVNIVKFHFKKEIDETTAGFNRFVVHLRFLLQRIHMTQESGEVIENDFFEQIKQKDTIECVKKICAYLEKKLNAGISNEEFLCLMLHINHLI